MLNTKQYIKISIDPTEKTGKVPNSSAKNQKETSYAVIPSFIPNGFLSWEILWYR